MKRVVITGMGVISPLGNDTATFWKNVRNGKSGISTIDLFDVTDSKTKIAGIVRDFDAEGIFGKKEARKIDRFSQFALAAAEQALIDSNINLDKIDRERLGVYVGSGIGGIQTLIDQVNTLNEKGPRRVSPNLVPMMIANAASAQISIRLGALGPSMSPVTACSIGNTSIGEAYRAIQHGDADVMFAGGAEAAITKLSLASFGNATALSTNNDQPTKASRPFDINRDGFVMSEGAGIIVLESLEHALQRDANIYGEMIGYGASSDAYHMVASHPEGNGASQAMNKALNDAKIAVHEVDVISAHATSTTVGDISETKAIKHVFKDHAYNIPVTANKSMFGHMLGATGGVEAIALLQSLIDHFIPPTINLEHPDPQCDLDYVANEGRHAQLNIGLSNSFGFGGHNAVIILKTFS
ncbi:beta-ketoacyl-ACP synthase II [Heyndrickxia ginsengihumi]|uniref:3-oxoacyl-[acyl-carrier-protein] synthase 2 n=1 Tax=Heyndrickxia ginsengihumi TaxID=363870 RepID=A0A0A6VCX4_9BACI|nr:beta-ketoacyl-ACP synthase II [Heyndrickxia ginsengihumi]KHD86145.1 3-oxoacyl-ACP synthase [Heyndrickxia ginsengihumi]MBE6183352.1 beta-ketoacyl-[acyl-carrier-protein] synthase II [Bacillus sp. (in: firmicutes)]MCM3024086.1 beta-ketoacyl-ACP synthase II [Heyndrickxia ginsengihumi]NEY21073.1 beta-ketoacyl-ACP synthase II [Heyndrickxia ginsengihumi]